MHVVGMVPKSQVERGGLFVAPYNYAPTFEGRRRVAQNSLGSSAFAANKR